MSIETQIQKAINEHAGALDSLCAQRSRLQFIADKIIHAVQEGHLLLVCGNGGSASQADHFAGELIGRFRAERRPVPAVALCSTIAGVTAIGNDYGFDEIFARQVEALGREGDLLLALSTSGDSPNILKAIDRAKSQRLYTIGFGGQDGGKMAALCDTCLIVGSSSTARIQEMHILAIHIVCEILDDALVRET